MVATMPKIRAVEVVLPGEPMAATLAFFRELGFRLESIRPADEPRVAVLSGFGMRLRLDTDTTAAPGVLRLEADGAEHLDGSTAPNGTLLQVAKQHHMAPVPPPANEAVVQRRSPTEHWTTGRAGMEYRDLVPGRMGGFVIGSHIRIERGGPVPDDVHFHDVRFQIIHVLNGWVRVDYEDQGLIDLIAGEGLLQPPHIRHKVLECSDNLEVIEVSSPAEHLTTIDHELELPTQRIDRMRDYGGQRFCVWQHPVVDSRRDARAAVPGERGVATATGGLAALYIDDVQTMRRRDEASDRLRFCYVTHGSFRLRLPNGREESLPPGSAATIPPGVVHTIDECSEDARMLRIELAQRHEPSPPVVRDAHGA